MKVLSFPFHNPFLFFLLVSGLVSTECLSAQRYQYELVQAQPSTLKISRTGKVAYKRMVNLSVKSSGYLKQLTIDEGERFSTAKLLAALDTAELKEEKNTAYARLVLAKKEVNRIKTLISKSLSSQKELDVATTEVETTRAAYAVAYYNLEKSQLLAPFNGIVVKRYADIGELQSPNQAILQVAALENNLVVKVALTSEEVSLVTLKQQVSVRLLNSTAINGYISKIPATAEAGSNLFLVEVLLPAIPPSNKVISGQFAQVDIAVTSEDFSYKLPITALSSVDKAGRAIIVLKQGEEHNQQTFAIDRLSNDFVYLSAVADSPTLHVVTLGWQHLISAATQDAKE